MIDSAVGPPTIPTPNPFVGVELSSYWSATEAGSSSAWSVSPFVPYVNNDFEKGGNLYVWPVRGGQ